MEFNSVYELKQRLLPALRLRKRELKKENRILSEDEIWNYFVENNWKSAIQLSLSEMVDDILNRDIKKKNQEML